MVMELTFHLLELQVLLLLLLLLLLWPRESQLGLMRLAKLDDTSTADQIAAWAAVAAAAARHRAATAADWTIIS